MSLNISDFQVWLDSPVTRVLIKELESERMNLEKKLKTSKFETVEEFRVCQAELKLIEKWLKEPETRLRNLIKINQQ